MQEKIIGDYNVVRKIGQSLLGMTYLVEHRFIKKQYILQLLPEELAREASFVGRFEKQIGCLASLDHPSIVKIYNVSFVGGLYFLITEYLPENIPLLEALPREEKEILSVLKQIAETLEYAHAKGIVHGSLQLSAIMVGKQGIYLSDLGLFPIVGVEHSSKSALLDTMAARMGWLQEGLSFSYNYVYFAPEQRKGHLATSKSDSYAFGIIAYYLLMGFFPEGSFPMPSEVKKYQFDFDSLIKACLSLDPAKRPDLSSMLFIEKQEPVYIETARETAEEFESIAEGAKKRLETLATAALSSAAKPQKVEMTLAAPVTATATAIDLLNPVQDESYAQALKAMLHREPVVTHYQPEKRHKDNLEPIQSEMMVIQGGQFTRGSQGGARDEMPKHQIYLKGFAIDVHPVTNEQFVRFLEYMGGEKDEQYNDLIRLRESRLQRVAGHLSIESGYLKHPVVGVTWYGACAYAKWVQKRLPTEAEWEAAATGGIAEPLYPTGEAIEKSQANFFSSETTPVKSYAPNGFGLYDMAGNVYEWCQDWYGYNYYELSQQEPNQPLGPLQGVYRVLRGGCWKSLKDDLRCAHRHRNNPGTVNGTYGFRCAADVG